MRKLTSIEIVIILAALGLSWTFQAAILMAAHSTADRVEIEELPQRTIEPGAGKGTKRLPQKEVIFPL